jgi:hypothetical protein
MFLTRILPRRAVSGGLGVNKKIKNKNKNVIRSTKF